MGELRRHFRPEFLNRVDEIVVFHPLETEQLTKIVEIQLERLRGRLAERRITLHDDAGGASTSGEHADTIRCTAPGR